MGLLPSDFWEDVDRRTEYENRLKALVARVRKLSPGESIKVEARGDGSWLVTFDKPAEPPA